MAQSNFDKRNTQYSQQRQTDNIVKAETVIPLSNEMKTKLRNPNCNFSLYSPRMVSWELKHGNGELQFYSGEEIKRDKNGNPITDENGNPKWEKKKDDAKEALCKTGNQLLKQVSGLLTTKHEQQKKYISVLKEQGIITFAFEAKTISPFITGLGVEHPMETGMILDRNIGVPYIPASSIKGVLRLACAINLAESKEAYKKKGEVPDTDATLVKYFGSMAQDADKQSRGQLMFLDAYPINIVTPNNEGILKLDIMNPHFGGYYSGNGEKQPVETESPVPIKFLTVAKEIKFVFRCAFIPLKDDSCNEAEIREMFKTAFEKVGFGGKTSIGYGRFEFKEIQE